MAKSAAKLSIRALAKALGRDDSTVRDWLKSGRWPFGKGPWSESQLPQIRAWMATLQPNRAAGDSDALELPSPTDSKKERILKMKILAERGKILEQQRKKNDAELLDKTAVQQKETAQAMVVMNELLTLRALAVKMEGLNLQQREQLLEATARDIARKFENAVV